MKEAVKDLCLRISNQTLREKLDKHPNTYSLLAFQDLFYDFNVDNITIKCSDMNRLISYKGSAIVQVMIDQNYLFAYVYSFLPNTVDWYNPIKLCREKIDFVKFMQLYTGYIMFAESNDRYCEPSFTSNRLKDLFKKSLLVLIALVIPAAIFLFITIRLFFDFTHVYTYLLTLLIFIGCVVCVMLVVKDLNLYSPLVSKICSRSHKVECAAVLESRYSTFIGIKWSEIGLSYFVGMLFSVLASNFDISVLSSISLIIIITLPYVAFSIICQKYYIKVWCPLCLVVMVILVLIFCISLFGGYIFVDVQILYTVIKVIACIFISFVIIRLSCKLSNTIRDFHHYYHVNNIIKSDKTVFESLLQKEKEIKTPSCDMGITIGNPNGKYQIVKFCNPNCRYCAEAQIELQKIIKDNHEVQVKMIFNICPDDKDYNLTPIDTFLSMYYEGKDVEKAIFEWYSIDRKNIEEFNSKYRTKQKCTERNLKNAWAMCQFYKDNLINGTPTIFVNGHQLPNMYSISDLRYVLNS
ncbi:MAG: vitamin K epoxide reductase family protein [Prevotella sp.]|nr:vitamin K epoxide reductase family protein [Prevotella sp.]